jgi:hypothetical protein
VFATHDLQFGASGALLTYLSIFLYDRGLRSVDS